MILTITIPHNGELLIKEGEFVDFGAPLVKQKATKEERIPLAQILKVPAKKIFQHLKKFVGEEVKKGDTIAEVKGMLGSKKYRSPYDGVLKEIHHQDGDIVLDVYSDQEKTNGSHFKGEIAGINGSEIKITVKDYKAYDLHEASDHFGGEIFFYDKSMSNSITEEHVTKKIALVEVVPSFDQVKLETLGAIGFISTQPLTDISSSPVARLKDESDWGKIRALNYPYCTIDKNNNTIYLYI